MTSPSPLAGEGLGRGEAERSRRKQLRHRAKTMRSLATNAEHRLWQIVRAKRFAGYKFRRQVPIDYYVADFLCASRRLIIELDGGQHAASERDEKRDAYLATQGFRILRFWNNEIFTNEEGVAEQIYLALSSPSPQPLSREGERGLSGVPYGK